MDSTSAPHFAFDLLEAEDIELIEFATNAEGWDCEYRQLSPGSYHGQIAGAAFNESFVVAEQHNQSVFVGGATPVDNYVFGISMCRAAHRYQGKQPGASDLFLLRPGTTFDYVFESNAKLAYIQFPRERMHTIRMAAGIDVGTLNQEILRIEPNAKKQLEHSFNLAINSISQSAPTLLAAQSMTTEQQLLGTLVDALSTVDLSKPSPDRLATPILARRIREHMEASLDEPLQMIDLCGELHCKLRTLHYAFTSYFGVPPSAYHKKARMNAARRALLNADLDATTVTNIATQYGFWHLGRFSVDYKRLFGELPSQTLATNKPRFNYTSLRHATNGPDHFGPRR